jgi:hypothetical protein
LTDTNGNGLVDFADAAIGNQFQQLRHRLFRIPAVMIDGCPDRARGDAVDANAPAGELLRQGLHEQRHTALRRGVIGMGSPGNSLMNRTHANDLADGL